MNAGFRLLAIVAAGVVVAHAQSDSGDRFVRNPDGVIIRGDVSTKRLALIFTGDTFGESTQPILDTLKQRNIHAGFFVTGNFIRQPALHKLLERAVAEGHYAGPHSDSHPLYASWDEPHKTLVTEAFFAGDLQKNIADLRALGALTKGQPLLFIPPYEHCNREQVAWARKLGVTLFNLSPGSGSTRDYIREGAPHFASSQNILDDILSFEAKSPRGLNGFILLLHLGSGRKDPFHPLLGQLCDEIARRGYKFVRIDELLRQ